MKIMVSACLLGENCKYDGGNNQNQELIQALSGHTVIPVCPEMMGGLPVPRVPVEIVDGVVRNSRGDSLDAAFRLGAEKALELAERENPVMIILQPRSPSCGVNEIYDGTFSGKLIPGQGLFADLALQAGYDVMDVDEALEQMAIPPIHHLRYAVIDTDKKARRYIIAMLSAVELPVVFLREWVEDTFFEGDYYSLYGNALTDVQAEEILECMKAGETRRARSLLKRYFTQTAPYCEAVGPVVLDDMIPDKWYDAWKKMEGAITSMRHFTGYWECDVEERDF